MKNPFQMPPEFKYAQAVAKMNLGNQIIKKFEMLLNESAEEKRQVLNFELKLDALKNNMQKADFERIIFDNAKAVNALQQQRLGGKSAFLDDFFKQEQIKIENGDFELAFATVGAFLHSRLEIFCFYVPFILGEVKQDFDNNKNFVEGLNDFENLKNNFDKDFQNLKFLFQIKKML